MAQNGRIVISNRTDYDWIRTYCFSHQINHWSFPKIIHKGESVNCFVEWSKNRFKKNYENCKGGTVYEFSGAKSSFFIGATAENGLNIFVEYDNLANLGTAHIDLGWYNNGTMPFFIYGNHNNGYTATKSLDLTDLSKKSIKDDLFKKESKKVQSKEVNKASTKQTEVKEQKLENDSKQKSKKDLIINQLDPTKLKDLISTDKFLLNTKDKIDQCESSSCFESFSLVFALLTLVFTLSVYIFVQNYRNLF